MRIRGAILSGLEVETEQAAQKKSLGLSTIVERLESLREVLPKRGSQSLDSWVNTVVSVAIGVLLDSGEEQHVADDHASSNPYASAELQCLQRKLTSSVSRLPPREATVIRLHYFEHQEFQFIAEEMHISKGRVSQLHQRALTRLKQILRADSESKLEL